MKSFIALTALLCATAAHAELYKSVDKSGHVTYSDVPPPTSVTSQAISGDTKDGPGLPYALLLVSRNNPVTLYTGPNCSPCADARRFLFQRGVPYSEKTVNTNDDVTRFTEKFKDSLLPLVTVGKDKISGFDATLWNASLNAAGYPTENLIPPNYKNGQASSLVTPAATPVSDTRTSPESASQPAPQPGADAPSTGKPTVPEFHFRF